MIVRWLVSYSRAWFAFAGAIIAACVGLIIFLSQGPMRDSPAFVYVIAALVLLLFLGSVIKTVPLIMEARRQHEADAAAVDRKLAAGSITELPNLADLDPIVMGITRTKYTNTASDVYVKRDIADAKLDEVLGKQAPPYPFVLVSGRTKAGKSRTLVEAARRNIAGTTPVLVFADKAAIATLVDYHSLASIERSIVWLDNLSPSDLEALSGRVLDYLQDRAFVFGTITSTHRAEVERTGSEVTVTARAALRRTTEVHLSFGATSEELATAQELYPRERFEQSIAEALAGGPELLAKYRAGEDQEPAGCALVRAAIDWRRCGISRPITERELELLLAHYLAELRPALDASAVFKRALEWAAAPVASQVALLQPDPVHRGSGWTALDHVVAADDEPQSEHARPIPSIAWNILLELAGPLEAYEIGHSAYVRDKYTVATEAFRQACRDLSSLHSDTAAMASLALGALLAKDGDLRGARVAYQMAVDSAHSDHAPVAAFALGRLLQKLGELNEAARAYQTAMDSRQLRIAAMAALSLGRVRVLLNDLNGAKRAYKSAIKSGDREAGPWGAAALGYLLSKEGDLVGARNSYMRAINSRNTRAGAKAQAMLDELTSDVLDIGGSEG